MVSIIGTLTSMAMLREECMLVLLKELHKMFDVTIKGCLSRKL